ncbi:MAG: hypothetical protein ACTSQJ_17925 [Promethearchaeota archaeon]
MKTENIKDAVNDCFERHKNIDDKIKCSFDTIAESIGELDTKIENNKLSIDRNKESIDKNTELIQDNANISKTILDIVKKNSERLDQYGNVLKQIPEMYEWFKDIKDDLGK